MRLDHLSIEGFRNLAQLAIDPAPTFNVFAGDNGQGKTNLIEAIYVIGRLRSFRSARLAQLIAHGGEQAFVRARVAWPGITSRVDIQLTPKGKRVRVDDKGIARIGDHCSRFRMVLFTPSDVDLPRGSPSERRRFLDRAIFNRSPGYLSDAQQLDDVLKRRNALLRTAREPVDPLLLRGYDEQLAAAGARVACRRRDFVLSMRPRFREIFREILGDVLEGDLRYRSTVPGVSDGAPLERVQERYLARLGACRGQDQARRYTTVGPQRDDVEMLLADRPLKEHASQGQHRLFVLALKITEIETLRELEGARPVLLLDDIGSELDERRNGLLFDYLSRVRGQVFLTTTDPAHARIPSSERRDFRLEGGQLCNAS